MRNLTKIILTLFFLGVSAWYLWPSLQSYFINQELAELEGEAKTEYEQANYEKIQRVNEESLKLGLDLLGGMHVALEVETDALIRDLATDTDQTFDEVLSAARERAQTEGVSVIDAFVQEFEERDPEARLSRYFRNTAEGITRRSTNEEVADYLDREANSAVDRAMEIIRDRVDRYGVTEPSIQKQGQRRIIVELPGVDDPERVRGLLKGTARLEFRLMANPQELRTSLQNIISYYEEQGGDVDSLVADTSVDRPGENFVTDADAAEEDTSFDVGQLLDQTEEPAEIGNPLLAVMQPVGEGVRFGLVAEQDTARVRALLSRPEVRRMLPDNIRLMYTAAPANQPGQGGPEQFFLLGVREEIEMTGSVITDARAERDQMNQPEVLMTMNSEGSRTWARLTGANIDKPIAIVLDDVVYSYPTVINRIVGGRSSITGLESSAEAQDIVTVLKSGALPAPVEIVEERTVGPSLGAASIRAGLLSIIVGLAAVALFMMFYYHKAGFVADLALLINIIFILGILAAFDATLTLPGIAGIVLTIGMAVDANVLIFDRIREEMNTGKTLKASVEGGYAKALSAIIDANITTFFVGAILYSFGVGPIQGFAVTLMAGILASLFSAIVFTRILFDYEILERRNRVSFG